MINKKKEMMALVAMLVLSVFLVSCSSTGQDQAAAGAMQISDPFEGYNRTMFKFNQAIDDAYIHPIALTYREVVPKPARTGVDNFLINIKSPVTFANEVLQGDFDGAGNVLIRAIVNTFVGLGGIFDVAGAEGYKYESEDFGQTLAVWGVDHGPYIVVPFIGPSTLRDYAGFIVDAMMDPLRWYLFNIEEDGIYYSKVAVEYVALRESLYDVLNDLETNSIDYYAAVRSTYYQRRDALVHDAGGDAFDAPSIPEYDDF
jgi:phospholipid-binding lipoprotein MlaA